MGTVRKRGKGYEIDYYADGRRYREAAGITKIEAMEVLGKRLREVREGRFFGTRSIKPIPIEELIEEYLKHFAGKSIEAERIHLNLIRDHFKRKLVSQITVHDVEKFLSVRRNVPKKSGEPRSAATCNRELGVLKRLLNKAIIWGMAATNPALSVKPLREPKGRTRSLSVEEAGRLLGVSPDHLRPILLTALDTGMRRGEILSMQWRNVDFANGLIFIPETKNGTPRYVPISDRLRESLKMLPLRVESDYVFAGAPGKGKVGIPFHDVRTSFETACRKAGIEGFRFHDLRHTAASHMVMRGVPLKTVGEILGHKTAAMTDRYSHLSPEHLRDAVNSLPDWSQGGRTVANRSQTENFGLPKNVVSLWKTWSGRADLNRRPLAPKASALPGCATSRRDGVFCEL